MTRLSFAVVALLFSIELHAQTAPRDSIPSDFVELADLRGALNAEISALERAVQALQDSLPIVEQYARMPGQFDALARRDSASLSSLSARTDSQETKLSSAISYLQRRRDDQAAPARIREQLQAKQAQLTAKKELAARVRARIAAILDPEQHFKRTMSVTFAMLIGLVIAGFFVLAFRDPNLREKVFGGAAGMQFLTLFSLVIAIILFGVTGVLEGKELSALLGGLSGYILGRSTDGQAQPAVLRVVGDQPAR